MYAEKRIILTDKAVFYRYLPRRALVVDGIFLGVIVPVFIHLLTRGVWPLAVIAGLLVGKTLKDLALESVIELRIEETFLIYRRRYLFHLTTVKIPLQEIRGASSRITSMWRGNIAEKLVLEAGDRELLLHPHYSRGDKTTAMVFTDLRNARELGERILKQRSAKKAQKRQKKRVKKRIWAMLQMGIDCPRCDSPVPVNGPWTLLQCSSCGASVELSPDMWADLLEDTARSVAHELKPGEGSESTIMGVYNVSLLAARMVPYCPGCKEDFAEPADCSGVLSCSCGNSMKLEKPPDWFRRVFPEACCIAGATRSTSLDNRTPEPVVVTCSSCGASFDARGELRNQPCPHCGTSFFLPDDLWHHFHPAPVKKRWFANYTASYCES